MKFKEHFLKPKIDEAVVSKADIKKKILALFDSKTAIKDKQVHNMAASLKIDPDVLEEAIYEVLRSFLGEGNSSTFKGTYDPAQMKIGIKIEMEHTTDTDLAEKISKDHLAEFPDYYTRLEKLEADAKAAEGK